jgi:hypothetical protein
MVASISLTVFIIVQLVLLGVRLAFEQEPLLGLNFFGGLIGGALTAFGAVALVFAALERLGVMPESEDEDWDPRQLPVIEEVNVINLGGTVAEITMSLVFIAVLIFLPDKIGAVISPALPGTDVIINPVFTSYLPLIILAILIGIGLDVVLLWRGRWETGTRLAKTGANLFSIYVLYVLIGAHNVWLGEHGITGFFPFTGALPAGFTPSMDTVQIIVMQAFRLAFVVALIVTAVDTANMSYRLFRQFAGDEPAPILPTAK